MGVYAYSYTKHAMEPLNREVNSMKVIAPLLYAVMPMAAAAQFGGASALPSAAIPKTTAVLVILTPAQGVTVQQILAVMPLEIEATVKLYLDGKIREWFSRGDGKGVIFLIDAKSENEAREIMETLPLAKQHLMDHQYIPVGPLAPLTLLVGP